MSRDKREFARIPVGFPVGVKSVDEERLEDLRLEIKMRPSVWAPTNETALRDMVSSASGSTEALLAEAVLELSAQVVRLRTRVMEQVEPWYTVDLVQLSGGGGQFVSELPVSEGDFLELRFSDDEDELPPIRALVEIVHTHSDHPKGAGFRFDAIHARDQQRLIRLIYQLQRRALRSQEQAS